MLQNAYFPAKIGADTAENEQHFAEILPTDALWRQRGSAACTAAGAWTAAPRPARPAESSGREASKVAEVLGEALAIKGNPDLLERLVALADEEPRLCLL